MEPPISNSKIEQSTFSPKQDSRVVVLILDNQILSSRQCGVQITYQSNFNQSNFKRGVYRYLARYSSQNFDPTELVYRFARYPTRHLAWLARQRCRGGVPLHPPSSAHPRHRQPPRKPRRAVVLPGSFGRSLSSRFRCYQIKPRCWASDRFPPS